jgi:hypothetical protein
MPRRKSRKLKRLDELGSLIDKFTGAQNFYFSKGYLNSEGRKLILRVSTVASSAFLESQVNTKTILGDCSDLHVLAKLQELSQLLRAATDRL